MEGDTAVFASRCCRATEILRFAGGLVVEVEVQVGSPLYRRLRLQYKTPRRLVGAPRHLHVASSSNIYRQHLPRYR
jgi:hypothetical protein